MPNWCHNTLTVTGEAEALAVFVEKVKTEEQPLSFGTVVPQPSDEELRKLESHKPCTMCGAYGTLPESEEQAAFRGARWYTWMDPAERKDRKCNVCGGSKEERVGSEGWYTWRCEAWGCKWDACFAESGPMFAIGGAEMDPDITKETQGVTVTPTVAVYKFDTPWAPPAPFVEAASEEYPGLTFTLRFAEMGEGYAGELRFVSGLIVDEETLDVEDVLSPEEMWF
jgi:hypothetical protein